MSAEPAFRGFIETTLDALLIFEGCRRRLLPKISRRLQEFEKRQLIVSGAVFVFDEEETGIKRWTDGLSWSPSRTLGNFLVYRELDKKANAAGAGSQAPGGSSSVDDDGYDDGVEKLLAGDGSGAPNTRQPSASTSRRQSLTDHSGATLPLDRARERALVGSLTSTYRFRSDGLVKKTISLAGLHMIGYYRIDDVTSGRLRAPTSHSELLSLQISPDFLSSTLFRMPPVVEIGPGGQLQYKGESEMPVSPLIRSNSFQGYASTSTAGPSNTGGASRPASSESILGRAPSPRLLQLPQLPSTSNGFMQAGSSSRGSSTSSFRAVNHRFEPYGVARSSPTTSSFPANPSYMFPGEASALPPSPRNNVGTLVSAEDPYGREPALEGMLSSSAPQQEHWSQRTQMVAPSPQSFRGQRRGSDAPSFYQPRHATPFVASNDRGSSALFAYHPPPQSASQMVPVDTSPAMRPSSTAGSPSLAYETYNAPMLPQPSDQYGQPMDSYSVVPPPHVSARPYGTYPQHQPPHDPSSSRMQPTMPSRRTPIEYDVGSHHSNRLADSLATFELPRAPQLPMTQPSASYSNYTAYNVAQPESYHDSPRTQGQPRQEFHSNHERQANGLVIGLPPDGGPTLPARRDSQSLGDLDQRLKGNEATVRVAHRPGPNDMNGHNAAWSKYGPPPQHAHGNWHPSRPGYS